MFTFWLRKTDSNRNVPKILKNKKLHKTGKKDTYNRIRILTYFSISLINLSTISEAFLRESYAGWDSLFLFTILQK